MKADWGRIEEVFLAALEQPALDREKFVANACDGDDPLRQEVISMLRSHEETRNFLETPAYQQNAELLAEQTGVLQIGEQVGDYRILSLLGEGGMGEVYLAEDLSLGRKVALKLVRPGFGGANLLRQFQREERILGGLTHPNIAQLYGAAFTVAGVPYFVMEYVEGERLDSYCESRHLSIRERLELFRKICSAVSYAHQHLVIHRDLKPGNIRVTPEGEPKLLDFGIAKLLDDESVAVPAQTITLTAAMTPDYASPEQLRGEAMTTATDVYSLGVILFELLTGQKPYRTKSRRIDEISRAITEQEPTRPSTAVARGGNSKFGPSRTGTRNSKLLKGDLDNIVLTAIRKEPARRYSSVNQFSDDIRRHLEGRPIVARKDTVGYRATKFIGRNRIAVAAAAVVVLAVVVALLVSLEQTKRARIQRDVAQRINSFLQNMLNSAAPESKGIDVKVIDLLSDASSRARTELADEPAVMSEILTTLGRTYFNLGSLDKAEADLQVALETSRKTNGELHPTTAGSMSGLGCVYAYRGRAAEGEQISRKAVELQRKLHPAGHEDLAVALYCLGVNLSVGNQPKAAQPFLAEAVTLVRKHLGETHGYYVTALVALATALDRAGETETAEKIYRQAIDVGGRGPARNRMYVAQAYGGLGVLLTNKAAYAEAEAAARQSEALYREVYGGDDNFSVAYNQSQLAYIYYLQADYVRAELEGKKAIEVLRKHLGPEHNTTLGTALTVGLSLTRNGKAIEGEPYLQEAVAVRKRTTPPGDAGTAHASSILGECLTAQRRFAEAEPFLVNGYNDLKAKLGDQNRRTVDARERLAKLYDDWNKPEQAAQFR